MKGESELENSCPDPGCSFASGVHSSMYLDKNTEKQTIFQKTVINGSKEGSIREKGGSLILQLGKINTFTEVFTNTRRISGNSLYYVNGMLR